MLPDVDALEQSPRQIAGGRRPEEKGDRQSRRASDPVHHGLRSDLGSSANRRLPVQNQSAFAWRRRGRGHSPSAPGCPPSAGACWEDGLPIRRGSRLPREHGLASSRHPWTLGLPACLAGLCGATAFAAAATVPVQGYRVKAVYPHDDKAYTEGLFFLNGVLFESTGLEGRSDLRRVRLKDGAVLQSRRLDPSLFGEG